MTTSAVINKIEEEKLRWKKLQKNQKELPELLCNKSEFYEAKNTLNSPKVVRMKRATK